MSSGVPARSGPAGDGPERFLRPCYTLPAEQVPGAAEMLAEVDPPAPMPELIDTVGVPLGRTDLEPLVPLAHRRIRVLSNYWHGCWAGASWRTWVRASVLDRLDVAVASLPDRMGLAVFDAWRPLPLQAELWDAAYAEPGLPPGYVADPDPDPRTPPPHLTGGVVDLTFTVDGIPLALGTGFDDFGPLAATDALEDEPGVSRELRRWLVATMNAAGFVVLHCEWWHFEHGTRRWAAITGQPARYGPAAPPMNPDPRSDPDHAPNH